jgi:chemotaxis methyl-accepting protein methylase
LGVDFAPTSIKRAKAKKIPNAEFMVCDIIKFQPKIVFDIIIFNEAFYYIHESEKVNVLNRMLAHLSKDGIILVSIYRKGIGVWEYFKENPDLNELAFTTLTTPVVKTYWKMGVYKKRK